MKDLLLKKEYFEDLRQFTELSPVVGVCRMEYSDEPIILEANHRFLNIMGCTGEELTKYCGDQFFEILSEDSVELAGLILSELMEGEDNSCEFTADVIRPNDERRVLHMFFTKDQSDPGHGFMMCTDITPARIWETEYRALKEKHELLLGISHSILFEYHPESRILDWNSRRACELTGKERMDNIPDSLFREEIIEKEFKSTVIQMFSNIHNGSEKVSCTVRSRFTGRPLWYQWELQRVHLNGRECVIGMATEINAQREAEINAAEVSQTSSVILSDSTFYFTADITEDRLLSFTSHVNDRKNTHAGEKYSDFVDYFLKHVMEEHREECRQTVSRESLLAYDFAGEGKISLDYISNFKDEKLGGWERLTMNVYADRATGNIRINAYVNDIDNMKRRQMDLLNSAQRDSLTGLLNKTHTELFTKQILEDDMGQGICHAFFMIDLDNFKHVNDDYGHMFGDEVLKGTAMIIKDTFRSGDIMGRIGGDEFTVLMRNIGNVQNARHKAAEICFRFKEYFASERHITCSIGISVFPMDGICFEDLYSFADAALYQSKKSGKNTYSVFDMNADSNGTGKSALDDLQ